MFATPATMKEAAVMFPLKVKPVTKLLVVMLKAPRGALAPTTPEKVIAPEPAVRVKG